MRTLFSELPEIFVCKDGDLFICEKQHEDGTWLKAEFKLNNREIAECRFVKLDKNYYPTGQPIEAFFRSSVQEHDGQMALSVVKGFQRYSEACELILRAEEILSVHGCVLDEVEVRCAG